MQTRGRRDNQYNDIQHNDTRRNGFKCDSQHKKYFLYYTEIVAMQSGVRISEIKLNVMAPSRVFGKTCSFLVNAIKLLKAVSYDFS
jgi:hypothetical protein